MSEDNDYQSGSDYNPSDGSSDGGANKRWEDVEQE